MQLAIVRLLYQMYLNTYGSGTADLDALGVLRRLVGQAFADKPEFDGTACGSGEVWFLATVLGTVERTCTIPADTALFVGLLNYEASDLEGVPTEAEQEATSIFFADHVVDLSVTLDGVPVSNLDA